jgi:hypothetical protein
MKKHIKKEYILYSLILTIIFMIPYYFNQVFEAHDLFFHLSRLDGIINAFEDGQILPKIYPYKNLGFGYASPLFYCDIFLYLPALLYKLGISLLNSLKVLIFISTFFASYFMMITTSIIIKNKYSAYISSLLYIFSTYHITDVFVRCALGEILALTIIPLVILSIYLIVIEKSNKYYILSISISILLLSHNISFIITIFYIILFCLCYIKKIITNKSILINLVKATTLSIGITSFFLFPMLEMLSTNDFYLNHVQDFLDFSTHSLTINQLFTNTMTVGRSGQYLTETKHMTLNIGYLLTFIPLGIFVITNKSLKNIYLIKTTLISYFFIILCTNLVPWNYLEFMNFIQYPWRFMAISLPLMSIVSSYVITNIHFNNKYSLYILIFITLINFSYQIIPVINTNNNISTNLKYNDISDGKYYDEYVSRTYNINELSGAEYLPYTVDMNYFSFSDKIRYTDLSEANIDYKRDGTHILFTVNEQKTNTFLYLPITYYKGYQIYLLDNNGNQIEHMYTFGDEYLQVVTFSIKDYTQGTFELVYRPTKIQIISLILSIFSLIITILILKKHCVKN